MWIHTNSFERSKACSEKVGLARVRGNSRSKVHLSGQLKYNHAHSLQSLRRHPCAHDGRHRLQVLSRGPASHAACEESLLLAGRSAPQDRVAGELAAATKNLQQILPLSTSTTSLPYESYTYLHSERPRGQCPSRRTGQAKPYQTPSRAVLPHT